MTIKQRHILLLIAGALLTFLLALGCRLLEWPAWQNPEFRLGNEMLLATHDAYHWVAGACGFGRAVDHPMAIILRFFSSLTGQIPAQIAFWFPAVMASFVGILVFLWCAALGAPIAGIAAGLIACISPGFLGRTLLGFYDTDLVTLFFPLLITLGPALWSMKFLRTPGQIFKRQFQKTPDAGADESLSPLAPAWLALLTFSGILGWWAQEWHSVFPYLVRYNVVLCLLMILILGRDKKRLLIAALAFALPTALGYWGVALVPLLLIRRFRSLWWILWLLALAFLAQGQIMDTLLAQVNAYLKHTGDVHSSGQESLVFPSVAQSIIEVQDLSFAALFPYFHPWLEAAIFGLAGFLLLLFLRPPVLYLLPLAILALLSSRLGGRMVMFGAPIAALGMALPFSWLVGRIFGKHGSATLKGWVTCLILAGIMVAPFLDMIPAMSQGPILNRRHAAALVQAGSLTPPDATLWLWWDWGYAAHYFSRRPTIADGAMHGGPSLYLPAAVYATENPRFARQIIKLCAEKGEPGDFFAGLNPQNAQELMESLKSSRTPLIEGKGKQYLITSFEMLKLGFWISNFGNWNFLTATGEGGAISIIPEAVAYRFNTGEVRLEGSASLILPTSINIFEETGVQQKNYVLDWFAAHPNATAAEQKAWLASRRNINFLFNRVTEEKLAVDQGIYNSLMVQLLLCDADDPKFAPYFRLIYDNVFTRIYEVLP